MIITPEKTATFEVLQEQRAIMAKILKKESEHSVYSDWGRIEGRDRKDLGKRFETSVQQPRKTNEHSYNKLLRVMFKTLGRQKWIEWTIKFLKKAIENWFLIFWTISFAGLAFLDKFECFFVSQKLIMEDWISNVPYYNLAYALSPGKFIRTQFYG